MGDTHTGWIVALVLSNVPAFFAAYRFAKYMWIENAIILLLSGIVSAFYHISDSTGDRVFLNQGQWGILDFWLAFSSIAVVGNFIARWPRKYAVWHFASLLLLIIWVLFWVVYNRTGLGTIFAIIGAIIGLIIVRFTCIGSGIPNDISWINVGTVAVFTGIGATMFIVAGNKAGDPSVYWWTHSIWHISIYTSAALAPDIYNPHRRFFFWRRKRGGKNNFVFAWPCCSADNLYEDYPHYSEFYFSEKVATKRAHLGGIQIVPSEEVHDMTAPTAEVESLYAPMDQAVDASDAKLLPL